MNLRSSLMQASTTMGLVLTDAQAEQLLQLLSQLMKWNAAYNLTAIRDEQEALKLHILDSLSLIPALSTGNLLDVGTGPGFPALPVAIIRPDIQVTALDSNNKKIRFIRQMAHDLALKNIVPVQTRVEAYVGQYQQITSRAFAELQKFVHLTEHLLAKEGVWLAMKSQLAETELKALPVGYRHEVLTLDVPGLNASRCLIKIQRCD